MEKSKTKIPIIFIFYLLYFVITCVIVYGYCKYGPGVNPWHGLGYLNDYPEHLVVCSSFETIFASEAQVYCMWHVLVVLLTNIFGIGQVYSASIVTAFFNTATVILINYFLKDSLKNETPKYICDILTVVISFVSTLLITFDIVVYYSGYIHFNIWHNPTYIAVKPFAVLLLILLKKCFDMYEEKKKLPAKLLISISVVMLISLLAKPSLIQILFPGFLIYFVLDIVLSKKHGSHFMLGVKLFVCCLPALAFIIYMIMFFFTGETDNGIAIQPFLVWKCFTNSILLVALSSFAFPAFVVASNIKNLRSIDKLVISVFSAGLLEYVLLAETGSRRFHGNFGWGLSLAYMMLWIVSVILFVKDVKARGYSKQSINAPLNMAGGKPLLISIEFVALFLHFIAGVIFCIGIMNVKITL